MKKFTIQAILLLIIITGALFLFRSQSGVPNLSFLPQSPSVRQLQINEAILKVEIADTQEKRKKGLGGRSFLASDSGMLFVFPEAKKYPFWMKDLNFPLDFVWIRGDKVVDVLTNIPAPGPDQKDADLPVYQSKEEVDKVLEVNAGVAQRLNIRAGDRIKLL